MRREGEKGDLLAVLGDGNFELLIGTDVGGDKREN
jgi:hypothetical protein